MKQFSILAVILSFLLLTQISNAQTETNPETMDLETESLTLDGSELEMPSASESEAVDSTTAERVPASEEKTQENAPSSTESDIGELTLTPDEEQMAEVKEPEANIEVSETPQANEAVSATLPVKESVEEAKELKTVSEPKFNFEENKMATPGQAPTNPSTNTVDLGPVVGDQKYKITCQLNDDIREITAIQQADGSVGVVYKRFDTVKTIAIARRDPAYADQVVDKIYNNLAHGKYPYACKKD